MSGPIKFYQTGTFTVGNRLLDESQRTVQADTHRTNSLNSGHRACQGCGEALGARYAIDAAMRATGTGTSGSGRTAGGISSIIALVRGTASCVATTRVTVTRKARPARPTTTRWARATRF